MIKSATISNNSVPVTPLPPNTHTCFFKGLYNEGQAKVQDLQWQYDELERAHQAGMRNWWVGETRVGHNRLPCNWPAFHFHSNQSFFFFARNAFRGR